MGKRLYNVYFFILSVFSFVCGYMILWHGYGDYFSRFNRHISHFEFWLVSVITGIVFMIGPSYYWYHGVRHLLGIQKRPKPDRNS